MTATKGKIVCVDLDDLNEVHAAWMKLAHIVDIMDQEKYFDLYELIEPIKTRMGNAIVFGSWPSSPDGEEEPAGKDEQPIDDPKGGMTIGPSTATAFLLTRSQWDELEDVYHGLIAVVSAAREVESGFASVVLELLDHRSDVIDELGCHILPVGEEVVNGALESQEIPEQLRERFAEELKKSKKEVRH